MFQIALNSLRKNIFHKSLLKRNLFMTIEFNFRVYLFKCFKIEKLKLIIYKIWENFFIQIIYQLEKKIC